MTHLGNHAIVVGGGIAGLLTARVLSDYFSQVTIVERDRLPNSPQARRGVAQSMQPHILFAKGYRILEGLFPDIGKELDAAGAIPIDWARELHYFNPKQGGWSATANSPSDIVSFTCSRPLLEGTIRQQVSRLDNVAFLQDCRVVELLNGNDNQVRGVRLQCFAEKTAKTLAGELVVDASGRSSQLPDWLDQLGYPSPLSTVIRPRLGYATCRYRIPAEKEPEGKVVLIGYHPPQGTRLGYLARIEGGEWIATLGGYGGDYAPTNEEEFLAFAKSLPSSKFYDAIRSSQRTTPIYAHRATANRVYHYEKMDLPRGLVALGDAVCALCPYYGQGMTMAALSSLALQSWLQQQTRKKLEKRFVSSQFQKQLAKSNAVGWSLATQQDSQFPTTQGAIAARGLSRALSAYTNWIAKQAHYNPKLHTYFLEIAQMIRSPIAFFHPWVLWQAMSNNQKNNTANPKTITN